MVVCVCSWVSGVCMCAHMGFVHMGGMDMHMGVKGGQVVCMGGVMGE